MRPTTEQAERMKRWLLELLLRTGKGLPEPAVPPTIIEDVKRGVDFSEVFARCCPWLIPRDLKLKSLWDTAGSPAH